MKLPIVEFTNLSQIYVSIIVAESIYLNFINRVLHQVHTEPSRWHSKAKVLQEKTSYT